MKHSNYSHTHVTNQSDKPEYTQGTFPSQIHDPTDHKPYIYFNQIQIHFSLIRSHGTSVTLWVFHCKSSLGDQILINVWLKIASKYFLTFPQYFLPKLSNFFLFIKRKNLYAGVQYNNELGIMGPACWSV